MMAEEGRMFGYNISVQESVMSEMGQAYSMFLFFQIMGRIMNRRTEVMKAVRMIQTLK
jgi:hypothetical protein